MATCALGITARALGRVHHRSGALLFTAGARSGDTSMLGRCDFGIILDKIVTTLDGFRKLVTVEFIGEYFSGAALGGFLDRENHGTLTLDTLTTAKAVKGGCCCSTRCALDESATVAFDCEFGWASVYTLSFYYGKRAHVSFSTCCCDHFRFSVFFVIVSIMLLQ